MGVNPGVFNILFLLSLFRDYKGAWRNLIFLLLFWVVSYFFGTYLLQQSDKYFDNANVIDPNPAFGYFLTGVLVFDFAAYFVKFRSIKYYVYQHKDYFSERMGCLSILEIFLIGTAVMYAIVPGIWVIRIIHPALPPDSPVFPCVIAFVAIRWGFVAYNAMFMTPNKSEEWDEYGPKAPPVILDRAADVVLTLTSTILYTVIWQLAVTRLLRDHPSFTAYFHTKATIVNIIGYPFFLCAYALFLYMPTRLIFIMEDYYALTNPKHRRAAFLTSVLFILVSIGTTLLNTFTHA